MAARVRPATAQDHDGWHAMRVALYGADAGTDEMDALLRDPQQAAYVAELENGHLGGFVEVGLRSFAEGCLTSPVGYVEGIWVEPELRGSGLGRRLFEVAEDWARAQGCSEMASDALLDNLLSHAVHRALGYTEVERHVCFYKRLAD